MPFNPPPHHGKTDGPGGGGGGEQGYTASGQPSSFVANVLVVNSDGTPQPNFYVQINLWKIPAASMPGDGSFAVPSGQPDAFATANTDSRGIASVTLTTAIQALFGTVTPDNVLSIVGGVGVAFGTQCNKPNGQWNGGISGSWSVIMFWTSLNSTIQISATFTYKNTAIQWTSFIHDTIWNLLGG